MNTKLTINSLAKSSLKHRKKQYSVMLLGILAAMIFSSTITFFTSSIFSSISEFEKSHYGNSDFFIISDKLNEDFYQKGLEDNIFSETGFAHIIGTIYSDKNREEYSMITARLDEKAKELSYLNISEGKYPEKEGEIMLEKSSLNILGPDISVGDSFTVYMKGQDGAKLLQNPIEKTFTLVGIAKDKRQNYVINSVNSVTLPGAFVSEEENLAPGTKELVGGYVNYGGNDPKHMYSEVRDYIEKTGISYLDYDVTYVRMEAEGTFAYSSDGETSLLLGIAIVFCVVLLLASFIAIINAMNSNLSERKKQIGMLRTVGATKRQIRKIFGRESILISLICAPVSVLVSYFITRIIISLLFSDDVIFVPNIPVLILSALFGIFSVIVASALPLYSASKISPVQSIRNIEITRQMKNKHIKSKENFSVPKLIANRNLTFYKRKQIVVSFFLVITVVLSTFGFSYLKYEQNNYYRWTTSDYKMHITSRGRLGYFNIKQYNTGFNENQKRDVENSQYFKEVNGHKNIEALVEIGEYDQYLQILEKHVSDITYEDSINDDGVSDNNKQFVFSEEYYQTKDFCSFENEFFSLPMFGLEGRIIESFEDKIIDGEINIDKINSGEEIILIAPRRVAYGNNGQFSYTHYDEYINKEKNEYKYEADLSFKAGDTFEITILTGEIEEEDYDNVKNPQIKKRTVKIGAIISPIDGEYITFNNGSFGLLATNSAFSFYIEDAKYLSLEGYLKDRYISEFSEETDKEITDYLTAVSSSVGERVNVYSSYAAQQETKLVIKILFTAILSVMILLLCGSASIINASLTSRIKEGKREIGILRAVGATQADLTKSYIKQLISMFGCGVGTGFGISVLSFIGIEIYEKVKNEKVLLEISILPAITASMILLIICSLNLYFKIKNETKNSIIDNIREL